MPLVTAGPITVMSKLLPTHEHEPLGPVPVGPSPSRKVIVGAALASCLFVSYQLGTARLAGVTSLDGTTENGKYDALELDGFDGAFQFYKQFNKWTLTSGSPELADENSHAMWWGMNMVCSSFPRALCANPFFSPALPCRTTNCGTRARRSSCS